MSCLPRGKYEGSRLQGRKPTLHLRKVRLSVGDMKKLAASVLSVIVTLAILSLIFFIVQTVPTDDEPVLKCPRPDCPKPSCPKPKCPKPKVNVTKKCNCPEPEIKKKITVDLPYNNIQPSHNQLGYELNRDNFCVDDIDTYGQVMAYLCNLLCLQII